MTAQQYLGAVVPDYAIVGTADYTGDGKTDVLWRHVASGELWLWRMNGATLEAVTLVATISPSFAVVASGDVNGDGRADILWRHQTNGDVWVWLMNGAVATSQVYLGAVTDLGYQVAGLADHDRDGRADVLWHHATSGDVWVWTMNGAAISGMTQVADGGGRELPRGGCGGLRRGRAGGRAVAPRDDGGGVGVADERRQHHVGDAGGDGAGRGVSDCEDEVAPAPRQRSRA